MEIHVIRHTPVHFDKNRCYGRLDVPLAGNYKDDAKTIKTKLDQAYDYVISSPKSRCTLLAQEMGFTEVNTDNRILELDFGTWEGKLWNEINQTELDLWMEDFVYHSPTQGESLDQMFTRVSNLLNELRVQEYEKILIITHAGVIRCFWAYFLEIPLKNIFKIPVHFNEVFKFNLGKNTQYDAIRQLK